MVVGKRMRNLVSAAVVAMDDGQDPFALGFLSEHSVTLDECYTLGGQLALGARLLLAVSTMATKGTQPDRLMAAMVVAQSVREVV